MDTQTLRHKRARRTALLLFVGLLAAYNINLRQVSSHDTYASRFVPISILRDGDLILDEFVPESLRQKAGDDFFSDYFVYVRGHFYDSHPPVGPLLALPVYALPAWTGVPARAELVANMFSKLAASLMIAFSGVLMFFASRALLQATRAGAADDAEQTDRVALFAAIAYGLATSVWSTASLAMWTHTPAVLGFAAALWALTSGRIAIAGVAAGAACFSRPATAPAVALLGLYLVHRAMRDGGTSPAAARSRADVIRFSAGAALTGLTGVLYNYWLFGNAVGGAPFRTGYWVEELGTTGMFEGSLPVGLAGLLISPSRGILIYSPVVLVAVYGAVRAWKASARVRNGADAGVIQPSRRDPARAIPQPRGDRHSSDLFEVHRLVGRPRLRAEVSDRCDALHRPAVRAWDVAALRTNVARPSWKSCSDCGAHVFDRHSSHRRILLAGVVDAEQQPAVPIPAVGLAREPDRVVHPRRPAHRSRRSCAVQEIRSVARSSHPAIGRADVFLECSYARAAPVRGDRSTRNNRRPSATITTPRRVQAVA